MDKIAVSVTQHLEAVQSVRGALRDKIIQAAEAINRTLANAGKVLICGNGGSAADAQHFAAELTGRFEKERPGLPAIALTTDTSALTAIGNDYGFDQVFSRQLEALGREGDLLIGISTSGNSPNVLLALESARQLGIKTLGLTGRDGGRIADLADLSLNVAVERTARIQETHLLILHILCELIEADLS